MLETRYAAARVVVFGEAGFRAAAVRRRGVSRPELARTCRESAVHLDTSHIACYNHDEKNKVASLGKKERSVKDKLFDNIPRNPDSECYQSITVFNQKCRN